MNHAHLRAFHAVAAEGGFTRAASFLNVSQPTLSEAAVSSVHAPRSALVSAVPVAQLTAAQLDAASADFPGTPHASSGPPGHHNARITRDAALRVPPERRL